MINYYYTNSHLKELKEDTPQVIQSLFKIGNKEVYNKGKERERVEETLRVIYM